MRFVRLFSEEKDGCSATPSRVPWPAPISIRSWKRRRPTASSRTHILRGCSRSCLWPRRSRTSRLYCLGTQSHHHPRARHHEKTANATPAGDTRGGGPRRRSELGARLSVLPKLSRCHIRSDDNDRRCLPADIWDHRFRPSPAPRTQTQERTSLIAFKVTAATTHSSLQETVHALSRSQLS